MSDLISCGYVRHNTTVYECFGKKFVEFADEWWVQTYEGDYEKLGECQIQYCPYLKLIHEDAVVVLHIQQERFQ